MASPTQNNQNTTSEQLSALLTQPQDDEDSRSLDVVEIEEASPSQSSAADVTPIQSSIQPCTEKRSNKSLFLGQLNWTIEAAAILVSIASMTTIIILLPMYENEPLSSWPLPVSLNVIISVLGATSRASMAFATSACISQGKWNWYRKRNDYVMVFDRFEEASRGPWGSLRLLWWTKFRHWIALGALSAVVLVGFEPFLQAVVTISGEELRFVGTANNTAIGKPQKLRSGYWDKSNSVAEVRPPDGESIRFEGVQVDYDFGALSAIWEGFSNLSTTDHPKPAFICSMGNCTWPPYASLAVCSACNDTSSHITSFSGKASVNDETIFSTKRWGNATANYTGHRINGQNLNITEPNGLVSEWPISDTMRNVELVAQSTCNPGLTISFRHLKTLVISFSMLKASQSYLNNSQRWEHTTVTAKECALYFCTNVYRSAAEQGVLRETVLGSYSNRNLDSYYVGNVGGNISRSRRMNQYLNHSLYWEHIQGTAWYTDLQLLISKEEYLSATGVSQVDDLRFNITNETTYTLLDWLRNEFSKRGRPPTKQLIYPDNEPFRPQPAATNGLGTSPNLTRTFENVAASLTKWIRNRSLQTEPFVGENTEWVVRIRVNWGFLTLPVGALLGGCIFCVLSIWETRDLGLPAWRGSSLATLAHGLDVDSRALLREASDGSQVASRARSLEVRFVDSEGVPELRKETKEVRRPV